MGLGWRVGTLSACLGLEGLSGALLQAAQLQFCSSGQAPSWHEGLDLSLSPASLSRWEGGGPLRQGNATAPTMEPGEGGFGVWDECCEERPAGSSFRSSRRQEPQDASTHFLSLQPHSKTGLGREDPCTAHHLSPL